MSGLTRSIAALAERLGAPDRATADRTSETVPPSREGQRPPVDLAEILAMSLDHFARESQLLEVRVPWLDVTVWFVPEEQDAEVLGREGIGRGRVWTARELATLMALRDRTPSVVRALAHTKCMVDGDIIEARPR
jgi:hypothetical protein